MGHEKKVARIQRQSCLEPAPVAAPKRRRGRPRKPPRAVAMPFQRVVDVLGERQAEATAAAWIGVSLRELRAGSRGSARISEARQVGMYLAHTVFRRNLTRVGQVFGRDRTTVRHACARIEDLRDGKRTDRALEELSNALSRWSLDFAQTLAGRRGSEG